MLAEAPLRSTSAGTEQGCCCGARTPSMHRRRCGASYQAPPWRSCCWQGNRRHRGLLAGVPLQSKGAAARLRHGTGAVAELLAGALLRSKGAVNAQAPMRSQLAGWPGRRCGARALARSTSGQQSASAAARQGRWQKARAGAGRQILSDSPSDLAITSAAQVLPYVFTAVRGISQSC